MFVIVLILVAFIMLAGVEIWLNVYRPLPFRLDAELGWTLKPYFFRPYRLKSLDGSEYSASFSTDEMGLRTHGSINSAKIKILALGDSFTADIFAGNQEMWFSVTADKLEKGIGLKKGEVFVWAGGGGGYGTYQNVLLLKRLLKSIQPDILILQFCENDFENNHKDWENSSIVRAQKYRRPYATINGHAVFSGDVLASLYRTPVVGELRLLNFLDGLITGVQYKYYKGYRPKLEPSVQARFITESVKITSGLLSSMRKELGQTPALMVNCSSDPGEPNQHWMDIGRTAGFTPTSEPSDRVLREIRAGKVLNYIDGAHFNINGNHVFGEAVADELMALGFLKPWQ